MRILQSRILLYNNLTLWHDVNKGVVNFTPLGQLYLSFLTNEIDNLMFSLLYSKINLTSVSNINLWKNSGRLDKWIDDIFIWDNIMLVPTAEEQAVNFVNLTLQTNKRYYPIRIYQQNSKFRKEERPTSLYRTIEFVMMDAYSLHNTKISALKEYFIVRNKIKKYLEKYLTINLETTDPSGMGEKAWHSQELNHIWDNKTIELSHAFCLGDTYSNDYMNCYGIGTTRLLNQIVESGQLYKIPLFDTVIVLNDKLNKLPAINFKNVLLLDAKTSLSSKFKLIEEMGIKKIFLYTDKTWFEIINNKRYRCFT